MQTTTDIQIKERPIRLYQHEVKGVLDGSQTQVRRVAKAFNPPEFEADAVHGIAPGEFIGWSGPHTPEPLFTQKLYKPGDGIVCPYGRPGDRLWVRETWGHEYGGGYLYKASHAHMTPGDNRWRPSIHMPRAASRITLEITDVRVERLQDISEAGAIAEGLRLLEKTTTIKAFTGITIPPYILNLAFLLHKCLISPFGNPSTARIPGSKTIGFGSSPSKKSEMGNIAHQPEQHPVDAFLQRHASEIAEPCRAWIRAAAVKAIQGADISLNHCPPHLRSELLGIIMDAAEARRKVVEAEYVERNRKAKFITGKNKMWI